MDGNQYGLNDIYAGHQPRARKICKQEKEMAANAKVNEIEAAYQNYVINKGINYKGGKEKLGSSINFVFTLEDADCNVVTDTLSRIPKTQNICSNSDIIIRIVRKLSTIEVSSIRIL